MTTLVFYLLVFFAVGVFFLFFHLVMGSVIRPSRMDEEKKTIYECGEPTIGSAWIQFDLRYYVVALLFVIFDVEVAFFFPWAVVFGSANTLANPDLELSKRQEISQQLNALEIQTREGIFKKAEADLKEAENRNKLGTITEKELKIARSNHDRSLSAYVEAKINIGPDTAYQMAWLGFGDILIFFGVLMVGFAYLWRRGDIDWVRSLSADKTGGAAVEELPVRAGARELAGAGQK